MDPRTTVYIVDDDEQMCKSLRWLIEPLGIKTSSYLSPKEFLEAFDPHAPGCLVLDVRMPGMSGLDLQDELAARGATIPIIFVSAHADVAMSVRAMKRGASEFLEKPFNQQVLIEKIQSAIESDNLARAKRAETAVVAARLSLLSSREREVLNLIVNGASNKSIAVELGITVRTVEAHRAKVMEKMRAESIVELLRTIAKVGL
jgi:two-component system response regulator FixJ